MKVHDNLEFVDTTGKALLYDIEKGNKSYDDEEVQFFIPAALYFCNFEWLKLIAENILIEEDKVIVENFLDKVELLAENNRLELDKSVKEKLRKMSKGDL